MQLLAVEDVVATLLDVAISHCKTALISGGTSSGKTTLLNALLKENPSKERLIVIEDTPELQLVYFDAVGLVAVAGIRGSHGHNR